MTELQIREMTVEDIDAAVALYRSGGWGERRSLLERILANPNCHSLAGVHDGVMVATGLATINGPVGWIGMIFVDRSLRSRGYGRAMTEAACARLDAAGCTTQALIASEFGRPLYEKMGFRIDAWYQMLEATPVAEAPTPPPGTTLRPMRPDDIDKVCRLDFRATGEDRRSLLGPLYGSGWLLESGDDLLGFLIGTSQSAAVIAPNPRDGTCLLDLLRHLGVGSQKNVRAAVVLDSDPALRQLAGSGWSRTYLEPRMLRGDPIRWEPALIWGMLGFSFG